MQSQKPDKVIRTNRSEIQVFFHYEEDPEKSRQAYEAFQTGLRYVAKQGGWLDALEERDAAMARVIELSKTLDK